MTLCYEKRKVCDERRRRRRRKGNKSYRHRMIYRNSRHGLGNPNVNCPCSNFKLTHPLTHRRMKSSVVEVSQTYAEEEVLFRLVMCTMSDS
jgi:hypothetical protein